VFGQMRKRGGKNGFRNRFVQQSPAVPKDFEGAESQPDFVKLDQELVRGAHGDRVRSVLLCAIADVAHPLGIGVVVGAVPSQIAPYTPTH